MIRMISVLSFVALPVACALTAPATAMQADADTDARLVKARIIVERSMPANQREAMFAQVFDSMMANMLSGMMQGDADLARSLEDNQEAAKVLADFVARQKKLALDDYSEAGPEMVEALAGTYAKRFSITELTEIEAFASTATGARFLQAGTQVFNDPAVAEWQRKLFAKSQAREAEELRRLMDELTPILEKQHAEPTDS